MAKKILVKREEKPDNFVYGGIAFIILLIASGLVMTYGQGIFDSLFG